MQWKKHGKWGLNGENVKHNTVIVACFLGDGCVWTPPLASAQFLKSILVFLADVMKN